MMPKGSFRKVIQWLFFNHYVPLFLDLATLAQKCIFKISLGYQFHASEQAVRTNLGIFCNQQGICRFADSLFALEKRFLVSIFIDENFRLVANQQCIQLRKFYIGGKSTKIEDFQILLEGLNLKIFKNKDFHIPKS